MTTPPDFTSGAILTAAQMNAVGLWLVKTQTIGAAVSAQAVTSCFSTDYDAYKIIVSGGVGSTAGDIGVSLGATVTGYYAAYSRVTYSTAAASLASDNNGTKWSRGGSGTTDVLYANFDLVNPFLAKRTFINGYTAFQSTGSSGGVMSGFLNDDTSYTGFTLTASAGTMTGGTIRIYGYRL